MELISPNEPTFELHIRNCELRMGEKANCSEYWLEILIEAELVDKNKFESLLQETREIGKILVASTRKVKEKIKQ
ncbi:four helix bundle protein [Nostoc sp. UCD120]|uniref:four helix bundle protein n=1 Tax=Nostoc sp. UCD120 TaxID=2681312 RepID=UPI0037C7E755